MAVIKNIKKKTEISKKLIFSLETITEELSKKYRMVGCEATWVENFLDDEGNDHGTCLVLEGTSVPRKRAAKPVEEATEE